MTTNTMSIKPRSLASEWPEGVTSIPYWLYQDAGVLKLEQERIYQGATWNYVCLEAEIPNTGDYRTTHVGEMPIIVTRHSDGEIYAFENRCAHRGALIALEDSGNAKELTCVYHAWSYDLTGTLKGVAFQRGVRGKGGMPESFRKEDHNPRKLRIATLCGLVFASLDDDVPPLEDYLGDEVVRCVERVLYKPAKVIGQFKQMLPNNWKLYFENVKDSYHASLLHVFFTTFRINRLSQKGGVIVSDSGAHHVSYSAIDPKEQESAEYQAEKLRSDKDGFRLRDPSMLDGVDEFGDGVTLQILSIFPGFVLQQIQNCIAVRQILPQGSQSTELNWTYLGFEDDTPQMEKMRLKQANLIGASGFVSMEDGAVGGFVQRGIRCAGDEFSVLQMGGAGISSSDYRATESSVRGFWHAYRSYMGL